MKAPGVDNSIKFLLVDDVEANLIALEGLLRRPGLTCLKAQSGTLALELLLEHEVALAIIDVQMPEINGFELAELMRGAERTRQVPIIFLTAGEIEKGRQFRGYEAGAVDFLYKPIEPQILRSKANVFFELAHQRQELARLLDERTRSEAEQEHLARQRQLALDAARLGWWHFDPRTQISRWDHRFREIFGITTDSEPNENVLRRLHPEDVPRVMAAVQGALNPAQPAPYSTEYRVLHSDGKWRWVEAHGLAIFEGEGAARHAVSFVGTVEDITARRAAEEELRRTTTLLKAISDHTRDAIFAKDVEGRITYANPATLALIGKPLDLVIGRTDLELLNDHAAAKRVMENDHRIMERGTAEDLEEVVPLPDGTPRVWYSRKIPYRARDGKVIGLLGVSRDITERKRLEEVLRESEERFRNTFENAAVGIAHVSLDGKWLSVNDTLCRITGYSREELLTKSFEDVTYPEDISADWEEAKRLIAGEISTYTMEKRYIRKDGALVWVTLTASLERSDDRIPRHFIAVVIDITERKRAEADLARAREQIERHAAELERAVAERTAQLRESVSELEAFSYSIAHDMRAPLRSMSGFSNLLMSDYAAALDEDGRLYLERIATSAKRMDQLITDVLNYSKVLRGDTTMVPINVVQLLSEIVESYPHLHRAGGAIQIDPQMPRVFGNTAMLTQVFSNLIGNALKFVPDGVLPNVRLWAEPRGNRVRIFVRDNGIGIPPDQHEKIFGMFQRAHKGYDGTGIGLAIVLKAVQRMGGSIGVESMPEKGSTFWVELPAAQ